MINRYRNPWHKDPTTLLPSARSKFYDNDAPCVFEFRGVKVFKLSKDHFDYVFEGCAITQRAGFDKAKGRELIDGILDGKESVCDGVADHLREHGLKPLSYPK